MPIKVGVLFSIPSLTLIDQSLNVMFLMSLFISNLFDSFRILNSEFKY